MTIFTDGFESGVPGVWDGSSGTPAQSSSYANEGTYSMLLNAYEYVYEDFTAQSPVYVRFYVYYGVLPDGVDKRVFLLREGGTQLLTLEYYQQAGTWRFILTNSLKSTGIGSYDVELSAGVWYCLEVMYQKDTNGTDGVAKLYVDGTERISSTDEDFDVTNASRVFLITDAYTSTEIYFDSVVVDTSYIGLVSAAAIASKRLLVGVGR